MPTGKQATHCSGSCKCRCCILLVPLLHLVNLLLLLVCY
jgi:hypothetical protein